MEVSAKTGENVKNVSKRFIYADKLQKLAFSMYKSLAYLSTT